MNSNDTLKKLETNIKAARSMFALALIMDLIYIVRAIFAKNLTFWFSLYSTQFAIKISAFAPSYRGEASEILCAAVIILTFAVCIVAVAMTGKKPKILIACLVLYLLDTAFMAFGFAVNFFGDFAADSVIDIVFHGFILLFLIVGIVSIYKKEKSEQVL